MAWLNFNNSINTLKGQITNFASNVLADEGPDITNKDVEELRNICIQQEIEINNLKRINQELSDQQVLRNNPEDSSQNATDDKWNWDTRENNSDQQLVNTPLPDLTKQLDELKKDKQDLIGQLEQLDLENQQNLLQIIGVKDKLQNENNDLKQKYTKLKEQHNILLSEQGNLKNQLEELEIKCVVPEKPENMDQCKEKYELQLRDNQNLKLKQEELQKELSVLKSTNTTLQKVFEDFKIATEQEKKNSNEIIKQLQSENKIIYAELQQAKNDIKRYEKKSSEDAENCQKLAFILESYDKQVSSLKHELEEKNEILQARSDNDEITTRLKEEIENIKKSKQEELDCLTQELENLKMLNRNLQEANSKLNEDNAKEMTELKASIENQENVISSLKERLTSNTDNEETTTDLKRELNDLKVNHENVLLQLHNKYVNIITENIRKFQDCDKPSDFQHCFYEDDPQIAEFSKHVEDILKILLDFKCKCEILEEEVYSLSEEKTKILTEKNHEIEKLIQNSEILSQEVITKTQTIKDLENECNELAKNNELLINELESYKNNSGLQTISESNEDNMVLLESQLENANKRIEDLEKIIDDFEEQKQDVQSENELDNAIKQLHITETEISNTQKDYQELLNSFDQLQIEFDNLKYDLEHAKENRKFISEENLELKSHLDKLKSEYENTEYQLSEYKINSDGLKEEVEGHKKKIESLIRENNKLRLLNEDACKDNENMIIELNTARERLLEEEDNRNKLEIQIRTLIEKLQNAKMTETSLKLQYDTVSKEVMVLSEVKHNLEATLNKITVELTEFQNRYVEIQYQNDKLIKDYQELQQTASMREKQIKNFEELVTDLQSKLEQYEVLAIDENKELLKQLSIGDNLKIIEELKLQLSKYESLAVDENEQLFKNLSISVSENPLSTTDINKEYNELKQQFDAVMEKKNAMQSELDKLTQVDLREALEKQAFLQQQLIEITNSRNELISIVTTKHQESVAYHNEIQRLSQLLTAENEKCKNLEITLNHLKANSRSNDEIELKNQELEKVIEQNSFLKEKCEIMAKNLLEEQSKVQQMLSEKSSASEKEVSLQKKLDRLQAHLIELEDHYTQELLQAEQKQAELQAKISEIKEREKSSSTMYTSVSIRANQQVESLQSQLQTAIAERDALRKKISDAEDLSSKQAVALANLQFVLEQFQKDKEKDVIKETERIRRQINAEKQVQDELRKEILGLKSQLEESKLGLQAASRLSDQLEHSKKLVGTLKEEVSQLQGKLAKSEEELKNVTSQTDGKVEKSLIKSLVIGFISSNHNLNKDQLQILKIIATVLDFNQQDHEKVNLNNKPQQTSWLTSFLAPEPEKQNASQESLSQAFIKYLETESKQRVMPSLLNASKPESTKSSTSSKSSTPRQSPIVLSEIVLPTFSDFAQNRNSGAILKDILKDNS